MSRQHYSVSNAGPVNNTSSSTWADIVQLPDFEPDASSTYAFFWSVALQNATNASADAQLRVRYGPVGFETTITTLNLESANVAEYPLIAGMFFHVEDVAPVGVICDLAIKPETNTNSINAKNGQIVALKLGVNDVKAESLTRQTTTSTTPADAVFVNFTSDGGDYVVIGSGDFDCNVSTVPVYTRLRCEGTNTGELGVRTNDLTNLTPGMMVWRFTSVPAGSRQAAFQYRAHTGSTAGITNARILVMRAADFDAVYGAQLTSDSTGTEADAVAITTTNTLTANPHLLLGGWGTSGTTANTNITTQLTEAGSDIAESIRRTYNAAAVRFHSSGFAAVRTPGSGSKTYTLDRVQAGSTSITVGAGSGLALIDLGSSGGAAPVGQGVEADTAFNLARRQIRVAGRADATEAALSLAPKQVRATGLSIDTATAFGLARVQIKATGLAIEADSSFSLSLAGTPVGLASEANTALALAPRQITAAGISSETDTARSFGSARPAGAALETSLALALAGKQARAIGRADETDNATARTAVQVRATGRADDSESALALAKKTILAAGRADETDTALGLAVGLVAIPVGLSIETATAFALTGRQSRTAGLATDAETAFALAMVAIGGVGLAQSTETASPLGSAVPAKAANENDEALALTGLGLVETEVPANRHARTRPGLTAATTKMTNRSAASDPDLRTATTSKGRRAA